MQVLFCINIFAQLKITFISFVRLSKRSVQFFKIPTTVLVVELSGWIIANESAFHQSYIFVYGGKTTYYEAVCHTLNVPIQSNST